MIVIAYQGTKNSNCYKAAFELAQKLNKDTKDGEIHLVAARSSQEVIDTMHSGFADYGLVAKTNSIAGKVEETFKALEKVNYNIVDTISLPIRHSLFSIAGSNISDITEVHSHKHALLQCSDAIDSLGINAVSNPDTALSAVYVRKTNKVNVGCLCTQEAGLRWGLTLLSEDLSNDKENQTKFLLINDVYKKEQNNDPALGCWEYVVSETDSKASVIPHQYSRFLVIDKEGDHYSVRGHMEGSERTMFKSSLVGLRYNYSLEDFISPNRSGKVYLDFEENDLNRMQGVFVVNNSNDIGKMSIKRVHKKLIEKLIGIKL